ncbi:PEP/pyruvate-binding domain-containing protein [soil metagenome]
MAAPWVRWLDGSATVAGEVGGPTLSAADVGGKGAGLAFLNSCTQDSAATVPRAFGVTTAAFERAITPELLTRIDRLITDADDLSTSELERTAAQARELIEHADMPTELVRAISDAYTELGGHEPEPPVAVRSSAAGEDAAGASFAGEHDSFLWISGADAVCQRVKDCWASSWTARAIAYRTKNAQAVTPMAVVVQHMVPAVAAGVFMTLNPVNGDRSKIVVEAVWGLGEPLVSGTVDPDRWVIDKITGDVASSTIVHKPTRVVRDTATGQGLETEPVPEQRADQPCLNASQLRQLVDVARQIERTAGCPQDGEFAVAPVAGADSSDGDDIIHLLQARPETVWDNAERPSITGGKSALGSIVDTLSRGSGWKTN